MSTRQSLCEPCNLKAQRWIAVRHRLQGRVWQGHPHDGHLDDQIHPIGCSKWYMLSAQPYHYICAETIPQTSYSLGNSNIINLLTYNGTSELLPATEVKLNLGNRVIKLIAVDSNLNCGSAYSFPTPHKWRKYTNCNITSNSVRLSILLGGDNYHCYPFDVEEDKKGVSCQVGTSS